MILQRFLSWRDVLAYARTGAPLYYQAPLDYRPSPLRQGKHEYGYEVRARSLRVYPPGCFGRGRRRTSDPFTADAGHLDRFRHPEASGGGIQLDPRRARRDPHRWGRGPRQLGQVLDAARTVLYHMPIGGSVVLFGVSIRRLGKDWYQGFGGWGLSGQSGATLKVEGLQRYSKSLSPEQFKRSLAAAQRMGREMREETYRRLRTPGAIGATSHVLHGRHYDPRRKRVKLTPVQQIPAYAVIIRAVHERGKTQAEAKAELRRRGLYLSPDQERQSRLSSAQLTRELVPKRSPRRRR